MHGQGLPICEDERPAPAYLAALVCKARCCTSPNLPSQKAPANQTTAKAFCPASSRHPSTEKLEPTCTLRKSRGLSLQPPQVTPPAAHPPHLAVSVVARGHPTEASLQLLALEARLPFVARASLHKSKKDSSFRSWPPRRERARSCARLFDRPLGIATCPTIYLMHPPHPSINHKPPFLVLGKARLSCAADRNKIMRWV
jgi:hypothetical protein